MHIRFTILGVCCDQTDGDGEITFDEFHKWWSEGGMAEVEAETEELPQELQELDLAQLDEAPMDMEESLAEVEEDRRRYYSWRSVKHHVFVLHGR